MDDANGDHGALGGWALRITAEVDIATVEEQVATGIENPLPTGTDTKKHKKGSKNKGKGKQRR